MPKPKTKPVIIKPSDIGELMLLECALVTNLQTLEEAVRRIERIKAALTELRARIQNDNAKRP